MIPSFGIDKIAEITLAFWIAKVIATTLGETVGDFLAHTLGLGYVTGVVITAVFLVVVLTLQIRSSRYRPVLFWAAIVATTTVGTEISDLLDRTLRLGYVLGSLFLVVGLVATLAVWYGRKRSLSVAPLADKESEAFFWVAVLFSNSLGTAFGDALVDVAGLSYLQGALVCSGVILVVLALHYLTSINAALLFWAAFVFTRPFGATFGDFLTKAHDKGGLDLGTLHTSAVVSVLLVAVVAFGARRGTERARLLERA